jgi:hypothetical protein
LVTLSTKYLAEAVLLLGIAWGIIRWVSRTLSEIAGGSRDAEGHRFLESTWRTTKPRAPAPAYGMAPSTRDPRDREFDAQRRTLDMTMRELTSDAPLTERAAAMTVDERQKIYDALVRELDAGGASDSERAFALAVAMKRLGLQSGSAATELVKPVKRSR